MTHLELKGFKGLRNLNDLNRGPIVKKPSSEKLVHISIDKIKPGKYQPRQIIEDEALTELASSIKSQGIIQPLIIRKTENDYYEIIAGERRWRAAKIVGLVSLPAIVKEIDDSVALAFALIENIQREDLNPMEEAAAFARFRDEFEMTHSDIAEMVGRARASITNTMRLLSLIDPVKEFLRAGQLDMGHARALLTLESEQQFLLAKKIIEKNLNVRDTEKLSQLMKLSDSTGVEQLTPPVNPYEEKYQDWSTKLSEKFFSKVTVKLNNKGEGRVVIHVNSPEEVDWLVERLAEKET